MAESMGFHVDPDIAHNGFHGTVSGTAAAVASLGAAEEIKVDAEVKTAGGKYSASAEEKFDKMSRFRMSAEGEVEAGFAASIAAGLTTNSGFMRVRNMDDVENVVAQAITNLQD